MRRIVGLLGSLVLGATLSGCWLQAGAGPNRTGFVDETSITAANVADLEVAWSRSTGTTAAGEAVVEKGVVFVHGGGQVTAFDLVSGATRWATPALPGAGAPAIQGGELRIPVDGPECALVTLDPADGSEIARRRLGPAAWPEASSSCRASDVLAAGDETLTSWTWGAVQPAPPGACNGQPGYWSAAGVTASGWERSEVAANCDPLAAARDPYRPPAALGDLAIVPRSFVLEAYPLAGCGAASCSALWSAHVYSDPAGWKTSGGAVALANGDLAIGMDTGRVEVVDPETHVVKWLGQAPGDVNSRSAVAATATSMVITSTTGVVAVYPIDGCGAFVCSPQWTATLPNMSSVRPSIGGDVLYVGHLDGTVSALAVGGCGTATCTPLWSAPTGSRITGPPVISNGHVVVGSIDGTVTAFALPASAR